MYITKVALENVRCFREATLDLESQGKATMWTVVVGDNGDGKTTLLRSIAMGLCDESSAAGLLRELTGDFVRADEKEASVMIELRNNRGKRYSILTQVRKLKAFEKVDQFLYDKPLGCVQGLSATGRVKEALKSDSFPWDSIFVCGYGAGREEEGTADYREYFAVDAVYTMFKYTQHLQNPELAWWRRLNHARRYARKGEKDRAEEVAHQEVSNLLGKILMLKKPYKIHLTSEGIEARWQGGRVPLGALGDGHRATVTWVLDLISWWMLHESNPRTTIGGIVLIDEIEQHLHPQWQRTIIQLLHDQFPKIQFITTTHSPLCAAGVADVPEDGAKLALLKRNEDGNVALVDDLPSLGGLRADQVLASEVFGYLIETNEGTEELLREASILAGKAERRSRAEDARYKKLKEQLKKLLVPDGQTLIEREIQSERHREMKSEITKLEERLFGGTG